MARVTFKLSAMLLTLPLFTIAARADDYLLAQSSAHKLKVYADGGAKWCGPHLTLKVALDADSPDIGNPAAVNDLLNRLKSPIGTDCAAATDATAAVSAPGKPLGSYKASKDGGWVFASNAPAVHQPASLDDEPAPTPAKATATAPAAAAAVPPTQPGDVAGSHDPAFLKRFQGSQIVYYLTRTFDQYNLVVGTDVKNTNRPAGAPPNYILFNDLNVAKMEGSVVRVIYRVPVGYTALELLRNYEDEFKQLGFDITGELLPCMHSYNYLGVEGTAFAQLGMEKMNNLYTIPGGNTDADGPACYFSARGTVDGKDVGASVMVVEKHGNLTPWKDLTLKEGEIVVGVDIVTAKAVAIQMVTVKASDIADALASKGSIDLYGIQFDVDKTDIKPESAKSLDEIASLMKIDKTLKLDISGHTDNTGSVEHNQQLSEGRAKAVVDALVKNYGIDPARLQSHGFGDTRPVADNANEAGKAKNRRVELRKI